MQANDRVIDLATNGAYGVNWGAFLLENPSSQSRKMS